MPNFHRQPANCETAADVNRSSPELDSYKTQVTDDGDDERQYFHRGLHPCLIPHVVDKILGYLYDNPKDLCNSRLVNKQWGDSASQVLRHRTELQIGCFRTNLVKLSEILETAKSSEFLPIGKFTLCQDIFQEESLPVLQNLLLGFSNVMESIKLWMDLKSTLIFDESSFIYQDERFRALRFPKLKSLEMDDQRRIDINFVDAGPRFLDWILQASPNLESLSIQYMRETEIPGVERPGQVNEMLMELFSRNRKSFRNLVYLKLDVHFNDSLMESLRKVFEGHTRLKSLYLCLRASQFKRDSFFNFLSNLRFGLEHLKITFLSQKSHFTVTFPRMENLKLFEISGWDRSFENVHFDNFTYTHNLPCLKSLLIGSWSNKEDWWQFLISNKNQAPVLTLQELKLPDEVCKTEYAREIVKLFPNLRKLDVKVSLQEIELLTIIFENLTQLTDLTIKKNSKAMERSTKRIDYIFTGIPQNYCDLMNKCKPLRYPLPLNDNILKNAADLKTQPGLMDLKNLKRLEIHDVQYIAEITDVTGYLVFLSMPVLKVLNTGISGMSHRCIQNLAKQFPNNMSAQASTPKLQSSQSIDELEEPLELPGRCFYL